MNFASVASRANLADLICCIQYAGWGLSQAFYREKLYETALGFTGLEDFLRRFWEGWALSKGKAARRAEI